MLVTTVDQAYVRASMLRLRQTSLPCDLDIGVNCVSLPAERYDRYASVIVDR